MSRKKKEKEIEPPPKSKIQSNEGPSNSSAQSNKKQSKKSYALPTEKHLGIQQSIQKPLVLSKQSWTDIADEKQIKIVVPPNSKDCIQSKQDDLAQAISQLAQSVTRIPSEMELQKKSQIGNGKLEIVNPIKEKKGLDSVLSFLGLNGQFEVLDNPAVWYFVPIQSQKMWHSGSLFVSFGKEVKEKVDVSFRIFGTEDEAIDLFQRTKIRHQSFLQSLFIDFDDKSKKWVICFQQNVTCTLTEWIDSKSLVAYENKKCLMNQELSKIINDILKAVQYLHEEGLRHGNLKSPMSYAIVHKSVLLLDIQYQNDGCDLSELMLYLKTFMDKGERRTEWLTFSKMVGIPDLTVEDLLRHPMLLDSESRLNNLHNQAKRISDRCAGVYPLNFLYALDNIEGYERWKEKVIGHPVFGRLINHTWFARTETASLLFRFVYNSVQHYNTEVRHHNAVPGDDQVVVVNSKMMNELLTEKFGDFLAECYVVMVKHEKLQK
ncbi:hypothetical protein O6P43_008781 [Quillaja saponaria]|uniref:Protein kinase domain-containing protein n=1 Tax=Quillaja saponaria TaxID=32244 RepID=A0AAD7M646_QUISA|nr:hypothetical protein O6P43_008781 [Quillaja saponaria]